MTRTEFQPGPATDHYHDTIGADEEVPGGVTTTPTLAQVLDAGRDADGIRIINVGEPDDPDDAATKQYVDDHSGGSVPTLAEVLGEGTDADGHVISNLADPGNPQDAVTKYVFDAEVTARGAAIDAAIDAEVTARNDAIAAAIPDTPTLSEVLTAGGSMEGNLMTGYHTGGGAASYLDLTGDSVVLQGGNGVGGTPGAFTVTGAGTGNGRVGVITDGAVGGAGDTLTADGSNGATWVNKLARIAAGVPSGAPTAGELSIAVDTTAVTGGIYAWSGVTWVKASSI